MNSISEIGIYALVPVLARSTRSHKISSTKQRKISHDASFALAQPHLNTGSYFNTVYARCLSRPYLAQMES